MEQIYTIKKKGKCSQDEVAAALDVLKHWLSALTQAQAPGAGSALLALGNLAACSPDVFEEALLRNGSRPIQELIEYWMDAWPGSECQALAAGFCGAAKLGWNFSLTSCSASHMTIWKPPSPGETAMAAWRSV